MQLAQEAVKLLYTSNDLAEALGRTRGQIHRWVARGALVPFGRTARGTLIFTQPQLEEALRTFGREDAADPR